MAVAAGGKAHGTEEGKMVKNGFRFAAVVVAALVVVGVLGSAAAQAPQRTFATAEEAVRVLVDAARAGDREALSAIFGPKGIEILSSGDPVADTIARAGFAAAAAEAMTLNRPAADRVVVVVGKDHWPFPIPVVKGADGWRFDTEAGRQEILNRHIGRNELRAIETCQAYVAAQREYASAVREADGVLKFAQQIVSDPGRRNGLFWEAGGGEESPLGPLMAAAVAEGRKPAKPGNPPAPYHGYLFKIVKAQGPSALGGAYSYVINGNMVAGFALVAWPAQYGASGIMTLVVNQNGVVYEKDLGPKTAEIAARITRYDPDRSWRKAQ